MRLILPLLLVLISSNILAQHNLVYPTTPKDSIVDIYFDSVHVADPYQWMEEPTDPRLKGWLNQQEDLIQKVESQQKQQFTLRNQLLTMFQNTYQKETTDFRETKEEKEIYEFEYEYISKNGTRNLNYKRTNEHHFRTLVNAKKFEKTKNDNILISGYTTWGHTLAVELSNNGSDWREVYFYNLLNGEQLPDTLKYVRNSSNLVFYKDVVYYDRFDVPEPGKEHLDMAKGQKLYLHTIGSSQSEDILLYENPDITGTNKFSFFMIEGSDKLFFHTFYLSGSKIYKALSYAPLSNDGSFYFNDFLIYENSKNADFTMHFTMGDSIILGTNLNAPNWKVLIADMTKKNALKELVPEYDVDLIEVNELGKNIACVYHNDGSYLSLIFNKKGELLKKIDFPAGKKVNYLFELNDDAQFTHFSLSSFYHPELWYELNLEDYSVKPVATVFTPYNAQTLETRYVKYKSKDGTEIPMYLTMKKDLKLNGKNPVLLYGYGGYGYSVTPEFDESQALWLLHGGILAIPNIRGSGSLGDNWSEAGRRLNKQNAFDDFIGAAEYLINEKYTSSEKLIINGKSHGGLLVAASFIQRPELFKAVVAEAGPYDMVRFNRFTIGSAAINVREFGTSANYDDFINLYSYSPLHNIITGTIYPNVLLLTGENDDRVPPLHTYKFLAALQAMASDESQYLMLQTPGAGHGGALTPEDYLRKQLFKYYFMFDQVGIKL